MKKIIVLLCLLMISTGAHAKKDRNRVVLDWATMYGVDEAFVGEENPVRGIMGDELPWTIAGGVHGCLAEDQTGHVVTTNVTTAGFPATPSGNSDIDTDLQLPAECVAPIVFIIAGSEEKWFAVTGFSSE
jgi:hypothetical protein